MGEGKDNLIPVFEYTKNKEMYVVVKGMLDEIFNKAEECKDQPDRISMAIHEIQTKALKKMGVNPMPPSRCFCCDYAFKFDNKCTHCPLPVGVCVKEDGNLLTKLFYAIREGNRVEVNKIFDMLIEMKPKEGVKYV